MSTFVKAPIPGITVGGKVIPGDPAVKPKRYLVFGGDSYYPSGGWSDLIGSADTLEDANAAVTASDNDWHSIIDMETGEQV